MLYATTRDVVVVVVAVEREREAPRFLHSRRILNRRLIRSIERDDVFFAAVTRAVLGKQTHKKQNKNESSSGALYATYRAIYIPYERVELENG